MNTTYRRPQFDPDDFTPLEGFDTGPNDTQDCFDYYTPRKHKSSVDIKNIFNWLKPKGIFEEDFLLQPPKASHAHQRLLPLKSRSETRERAPTRERKLLVSRNSLTVENGIPVKSQLGLPKVCKPDTLPVKLINVNGDKYFSANRYNFCQSKQHKRYAPPLERNLTGSTSQVQQSSSNITTAMTSLIKPLNIKTGKSRKTIMRIERIKSEAGPISDCLRLKSLDGRTKLSIPSLQPSKNYRAQSISNQIPIHAYINSLRPFNQNLKDIETS